MDESSGEQYWERECERLERENAKLKADLADRDRQIEKAVDLMLTQETCPKDPDPEAEDCDKCIRAYLKEN